MGKQISRVRLDRDKDVAGKRHGVCVYIKESWCNNVTVRDKICSSEIKMLVLSPCPFYLPREFPQLYFLVYIHPWAKMDAATDVLIDTLHKLDATSPDSSKSILGILIYVLWTKF